ncbi:DUF2590 family protein [Sodalis sp. RH18]|uniref:DUF2590 family protein n=1 Tax=Sodalis sp. RH18 TaxID=3394333 RepID=UPI0039B37F9B
MASDVLYIDLLITNRDFTLDPGGEPVLCNNRISIAQDIKHSIMESGLATLLVAERSPTLRADIMMRIEFLVEDDTRLVPGTIQIVEETTGRLLILAETYDFGPVDAAVSYGN